MLSGPRATVKMARKLRREMSYPEILLWQRLKLQPEGLKFRRQHPAGKYVLDFFCADARMAVEVDGAVHDMGTRPQHDAARDAWLVEAGLEVLRIPASDVLKSADRIADAIVRLCLDRIPVPPRAPLGEGDRLGAAGVVEGNGGDAEDPTHGSDRAGPLHHPATRDGPPPLRLRAGEERR